MTGVICEICDTQATENKEIFYQIRITDSGLDVSEGMADYTLCGSCLASKLDTPVKRNRIQSILRIENPMMG